MKTWKAAAAAVLVLAIAGCATSPGEPPHRSLSYSRLAQEAYDDERWLDAIVLWQRAIELAREHGDPELAAAYMNNIGAAYDRMDVLRAALRSYQAALEANRELELPREVAANANNLAGIHLRLGQIDEAQAHYDLALATFDELGDLAGVAATLNNLGLVDRRQGRTLEAAARYAQAIEFAERAGATGILADALYNLARVRAEEGAHAEAIRLLEQALVHFRGEGDIPGEVDALVKLGESHRASGSLDRSAECYATVLEVLDVFGDERQVLATLRTLADIHGLLGQYERAEAYRGRATRLESALERE